MDELQAKKAQLSEKLDIKKEAAFEKDLVLEELASLSSRLHESAAAGVQCFYEQCSWSSQSTRRHVRKVNHVAELQPAVSPNFGTALRIYRWESLLEWVHQCVCACTAHSSILNPFCSAICMPAADVP